jgi:predicted MPP superfamily phosphohydrolase
MRRFSWVGLLVLVALLGALEYYTYMALRMAISTVRQPYKQWIMITYVVITLIWFAVLLSFPVLRTAHMPKGLRNFLISFSMGLLLTKLLISLILVLDDVKRLVFYLIDKLYGDKPSPSIVESGMSRSEFINKMALLLGGTLFGGLLYGMTNKYNYQVKRIALQVKNLPNALKGLRIVQISDIHTGSLNDKKAVAKGVQMILDQKPDVIFFTGDLVNNSSDEAEDYISVLKELTAPMGVYSILGNHDYGDYISWESTEAKENNLARLKAIHKEMGWHLLLDEHIVLERNGQQMAVLGVQNTSFRNNFHSYGNLSKAYQGVPDVPFKILLSHDPSHWDGEVNTSYSDIDLTLSGHTHGFQFGVEIPWLKWSPVQYIYKQWAGLYQQGEQYLYVNRGFGFLGYPGRLGILPEITCLELV